MRSADARCLEEQVWDRDSGGGLDQMLLNRNADDWLAFGGELNR